MDICFGDLARIKKTDITEKLGCAGRVGVVFGETIPIHSSVDVEEVIGNCSEGKALFVQFEDYDDDEGYWFAEELVDLVEKRSSKIFHQQFLKAPKIVNPSVDKLFFTDRSGQTLKAKIESHIDSTGSI